MKRVSYTFVHASQILGLASIVVLSLGWIPIFAQGGNGGRPGGEESTMNLSYPANFAGTPMQTGIIGSYSLTAMFPAGMSYGCAIPEVIGTTTYPNTSCVTISGATFAPDTREACMTRCGGQPVERIYWQKDTKNKWQSGYVPSISLPVLFVDWGDNLEGRTWPAQILRVETNTFSQIGPTTRFEMWHVFGQGTTELWGVHATDADSPKPYVYASTVGAPNWGYAVNVANTSGGAARLNIAKLQDGLGSACPAIATNVTQSPFRPTGDPSGPNLQWDLSARQWRYPNGNAVPYTRDLAYGAELNIKGSYVYGYNWNLRTEPIPVKAGWWRLTLYSPEALTFDFSAWQPPGLVDTLAPPADATSIPTSLAAPSSSGAESESGGRLYVPQIDNVYNLTYLDVCIKEGTGGGGKGGR